MIISRCLARLWRALPLLIVGFATCACSGSVLPEALPEAKPASGSSHRDPVDLSAGEAGALYIEARLRDLDGDNEGALLLLRQAVELDPHDAYLRLSLADQYLVQGQMEQALRAVEDAVIQEPDFAEAHFMLGNLVFHNGNNEKAIQSFRKVIELAPDHEEAPLLLAVAHARNDDLDQAVDVLKTFIESHPDSVRGAVTLARLYQEMELTGRAVEIYQKLLEKNPDTELAYFEMGGLYEEQGDSALALETYRALLARDPRNVAMRHHIARFFISRQEYAEALRELDEILLQRSDDQEARRKIGLIYLEQENWDAASEVFGEILRQRPDLHQARFYLGSALERNDKFQEALRVFAEIPEASEFYDESLAHLSYLHHRLGRTDEAIEILEKLIAKGGEGRPELYAFLASLYEDNKLIDEAVAALDRGLRAFPGDSGLLYHQGVILERSGERDRAIEAMRKVVEVDPEHAEALNFLAYIFAEEGIRLEEALNLVNRALEIKPEGHVVDTRGWIYFKLRRFAEARAELERAADLLPEDPVVREHLGDVYRALQLPDKARTAYRKALELDPEAVSARDKLKTLTP